jgi:hypothetical protein
MDEVGHLLADRRPELTDERLRRIPDPPPVLGETCAVEELGPTGLRDPPRGRLRNETDGGTCPRESALRVEHAL